MSDAGTAAVTQTAGSTSTSSGTIEAPFAVRLINVDMTIGTTVTSIAGARVSVTIEHAQYPTPGANCIALIYGLKLQVMNQLSIAGLQWATTARKNEISISAGDSLTGMTTVFQGIIQEAYPAFNQPDAPFFVRASPGPIIQLKPVPPISYPGQVSAAAALSTMAKNAGLTLENNGVSVQLMAPYFAGTAWDQIVSACRAANIYATIDSVSGVLAIWPKTGSRGGNVVLAPETGLIGYPQFSQAKVTVRNLFTSQVRAITIGPGQTVTVRSELTAANGTFVCSSLTFHLESQKPGGLWEAVVELYQAPFGQGGS